MNTSPTHQNASPAAITSARRPEDLLAYMPYALGYWPEDSLLLASATESHLGPCLRIDLPSREEHLPEWASALPEVVPALTADPRIRRVFVAAFTACPDLDAHRQNGAVPQSEATGDFACTSPVAMALSLAGTVCAEHGMDPTETWVVDRSRRRWGSLLYGEAPFDRENAWQRRDPVPEADRVWGALGHPRDEAGDITVRYRGDTESILSSPLATALTFAGHTVRDRVDAVMDDPRLPGSWPLSSALEPDAVQSLRQGFSSPPSRRNPERMLRVEVLDALVERLAAVFEDAGNVREAALRCTAGLTAEDCSEIGAWLRAPAGLCAMLACAVRGPEASRHVWDESRSGDMARPDGTVSDFVSFFTGGSVGGVDPDRIRGLRVALNAAEYLADHETADRAMAANAFLSWCLGLNSQAEEYLQRVRTPGGSPFANILRSVMAQRPLPEWLNGPWDAGHRPK